MISVGDKVKFNGSITDTGTGIFTVSIGEFFVDNEWKTLATPITQEIKSADYSSAFTSAELAYIKKKADTDSKSTTLCDDDLAVVKSIASKLKDNK